MHNRKAIKESNWRSHSRSVPGPPGLEDLITCWPLYLLISRPISYFQFNFRPGVECRLHLPVPFIFILPDPLRRKKKKKNHLEGLDSFFDPITCSSGIKTGIAKAWFSKDGLKIILSSPLTQCFGVARNVMCVYNVY